MTFLIPVSALLLGTGLLGETIAPWQLVGMAVIGFGLAVIDGRPVGFLGCQSGARPGPAGFPDSASD